MKILHLSDTHLDRAGGPDADGADGTAALRRLLADLVHLSDLDAVVVTGDVADDGSSEGYSRARELLGGYAKERGASVFYATGNHDERAAFTEVLGCGHTRPDAVCDGPDGERAAASTIDGWRVVTLDSLVPGKGYGQISRAQLDWLRGVLAAPAPRGTILGFHHPPIALEVEVQRALGLQNADELAAVIRGTDVHSSSAATFTFRFWGIWSRRRSGSRPGWSAAST
ncbi:metallophosphoesterase family protein [Streptomyces sp. NPDC003233]